METITLNKYHGLGNDYLVLDPNKNDIKLQDRQIENICRRNFGVCADDLLYGPVVENGKYTLRIYNHDGVQEVSRNGLRIFAKYLKDSGYTTDGSLIIKTFSDETTVDVSDDSASLGGNVGTIRLAENFFS